MPCYDPRTDSDRRETEIAAAVRGFLLCRIMTDSQDTTFTEMADTWFRAHQRTDAAATLLKANLRKPECRRDLDRAREDLVRVERHIHERLVKARVLEKI